MYWLASDSTSNLELLLALTRGNDDLLGDDMRGGQGNRHLPGRGRQLLPRPPDGFCSASRLTMLPSETTSLGNTSIA
jgi:hypothetical protein